MSTQEQLNGTVDRLLYHNEQNGYVVFALTIPNKKSTTVIGHMPAIRPGEQVTLSGIWIVHPKFGKQFQAQSCVAHQPTSIIGLKKYLSSGLIKGIGPTYAEKLVDRFGHAVLSVIDAQPERLNEIEGIGPKRVEKIITAWQDQKDISNIMVFLQEKGVSTAYAAKIYKKYKQEAISVITENPYRLADDIWGIGFKLADDIARNMGIEHTSLKRITSGLLFTLTNIIGRGHLYAELSELKKTAFELLDIEEQETSDTVKMALHNLYEFRRISLISHNDKHFVTLPRHYTAEKGIAEKVHTLLSHASPHDFDIPTIHRQMRTPSEKNNITLNDDQQRGILTALEQKVTIITGGPGTGKTTLIKTFLQQLDIHKISYLLAAPTGRAAKRMQESTGRHAQTIHRLLEFDVSTMRFSRNEENALKTSFLIVDEASMLDAALAHAVFKAIPLRAHILFIGDVDQLPSVGPGNVLKNLIESNKVPCVRLKTIFRQAQDSLIVVNAHRVNRGEFPSSVPTGSKRDFLFIKEENPELLPKHIEHVIRKGLPRFGIKQDDAVVLTPMNRGAAGTQRLNHEMQKLLNPKESGPTISHFGTTFKVGDRVMQLRNNYDKKVFNGDIGFIEEINVQDQQVFVRYPEQRIEYEKSELDELTLAYAISIHKSQGSEYPAVIVPIFMQHFMLLQRNLIYTAITRAKKLCIFIGQPRAIAMAVKNEKGTVRTTFLREFITSNLECR